jgi:hypothetical protein
MISRTTLGRRVIDNGKDPCIEYFFSCSGQRTDALDAHPRLTGDFVFIHEGRLHLEDGCAADDHAIEGDLGVLECKSGYSVAHFWLVQLVDD